MSEILRPINKRSTEDLALDTLRLHIVNGGAPAGSRLTEAGLSSSLDISRGTVRTALHRLASEGLIVQMPYSGWHVIPLTARDVWELYTLRAPLEALAARLAAENLDREGKRKIQDAFDDLVDACKVGAGARIAECDFALHQTMVDQSGHVRLCQQYRLVEQQVRLFIASSCALIAEPTEIVEQHRPLVRAVLVRDPDRAASIAEAHTLSEGQKLEAFVRSKESDPISNKRSSGRIRNQ